MLEWTTTGAETLTITGGETIDTSDIPAGNAVVRPTTTTTYTLTATGASGTPPVVRTVTITVIPMAIVHSFGFTETSDATGADIFEGEEVTLTWTTSNATSVIIDNGVSASRTSGTVTVRPAKTTTYELTAVWVGGIVQADNVVTVTVIERPTITFTATPINGGGESTLSWQVSGADSIALTDNDSSTDDATVYADATNFNSSKVVSLTRTTTYTLTATWGGGTLASQVTVRVGSGTTAPRILSFTANPSTITANNETVLEWTTSNATGVTISDVTGTSDVAAGRAVVRPTETTTYTLTATGASGTTPVTRTVTVTVHQVPEIVSFVAEEIPDTPGGETYKLSWTTLHATRVTIDNGVSAVALNGSVEVSPSTTTTYRLTASGPGGAVTRDVTADIYPRPSINKFDADPDTIISGEDVTLTWTTPDATSVAITDNDPDTVDEDLYAGLSVSSSKSVMPTATTGNRTITYTLTVKNSAGVTVTATTTLTVKPAPPTVTGFTADPVSVGSGGRVNFTWTATGATSIAISDGSTNVYSTSTSVEETEGATAVRPTGEVDDEITYALTATGPGGTTTASTPEITIVAGPGIDFTASRYRVPSGGSVTLRWTTTNATSVVITSDSTDGSMNVYTASTLNQARSGSVTVNPEVDTTYTLEATGNGVTNSASVSVEIIPPPTVTDFDADPGNVALRGLVNLTWTTTEATSLVIKAGTSTVYSTGTQDQVDSGTAGVTPTADTTYTLTATGPSGTVISAPLEVTIARPTVVSFEADGAVSTSVELRDSVTLTWTTTSAASITINDGSDDIYTTSTLSQLDSGSFTVTPDANTTYILTATGPGGTYITSVNVTIDPPMVDRFESIVNGGRTSLEWDVIGAESITINDGTSNFYDIDMGSALKRGRVFVSPIETTTYMLTATGPGGTATGNPVEVTVTAMATEVVDSAPPTIDSFTANPTEVMSDNNQSTLTWETTGATSVAINGVTDTLLVDGNTDVYPTVTTIYTLTAIGPGGLFTAPATVTVTDTTTPDAPTINSFTATPDTSKSGADVLLKWQTNNATSVVLNHGSDEFYRTTTMSAVDNGSVTVVPTVTTTYTLNAAGPGGNTTTTVKVTVTDAEDEGSDRVRPKIVTLTVNGTAVGGHTETETVNGVELSVYIASLGREPQEGDFVDLVSTITDETTVNVGANDDAVFEWTTSNATRFTISWRRDVEPLQLDGRTTLADSLAYSTRHTIVTVDSGTFTLPPPRGGWPSGTSDLYLVRAGGNGFTDEKYVRVVSP